MPCLAQDHGGVVVSIVDKLRTGVMGSTGDAQPDTREAGSSRRKWPHLVDDLALLAGGCAVDGPLGLLAVEEEERLAADRDHTTAEEE
jgi:hypothetical protein